MAITSVQYGNADKSSFVVVDDGITMFVPDDKLNRERQMIDVWLETDGNVIAEFPTPAPVIPQVISDRQFYQQLAVNKTITQDEAIAAVSTGTIPATIKNLISQLPTAQQFPATMMLAGATQFERNNPVTKILEQLEGWTDAETDALFVAAAQL